MQYICVCLSLSEFQKSSGGIRVAFIPNAEGPMNDRNLNRLVWAASQTLDGVEATDVVLNWLVDKPKSTADTSFIIPPDAVKDLMSSTELHMKMLRVYVQRVINVKATQTAVIVNGHIIGALNDDEHFNTDDFGLIERFTSHQYADKIRKALLQGQAGDDDTSDVEITSDTILRLITTLVPRTQTRSRFAIPPEIQDAHTAVKLPPKSNTEPYFDVFAVVDPASKEAQKLASILLLLRSVVNCNMRVLMCAVDKHSDMPIKK